MKILVRSTNWLGDAVMSTPALMRLREKFPGAHIAILAAEKLRELWANHTAVNKTIFFAPGESVFSIGKRLRAEKFDIALVLPNSPRSALEVFLAGIPKRIGYARPWRDYFLTQTVASRAEAVKMDKRSAAEIKGLAAGNSKFKIQNSKFTPEAHQIHEYLHLAAALGANSEPLPPQLFVAPEEIETAQKKFGLDKISNPIFGLNPGAEYGPAKRWPVERFILAAKEIQQRTGCIWILFGGKGDFQLCERVESEIQNSKFKIQNICGQTSLRELMSLLKLCRVLLTNDTGPMHVAAALGTPVVVPFGSTSPELTGPGLPGDARHLLLKSDAPCSPCFLRECPIDFRCMNGIGVERVVEAVLQAVRRFVFHPKKCP
ncbi:MAG TPA: lipopolysaccharide heptosyltransferase II [Candidatus Paceibacterota bacterium]|nr:lipopolysaccharide heptosyltransferase II [Candidatus Paceibacterota bacterium]